MGLPPANSSPRHLKLKTETEDSTCAPWLTMKLKKKKKFWTDGALNTKQAVHLKRRQNPALPSHLVRRAVACINNAAL